MENAVIFFFFVFLNFSGLAFLLTFCYGSFEFAVHLDNDSCRASMIIKPLKKTQLCLIELSTNIKNYS